MRAFIAALLTVGLAVIFRSHGFLGLGAQNTSALGSDVASERMPVVNDRRLPNSRLTPGATLPVSVADLCRPGYTRVVRRVTIAMKRDVYREYGVRYERGANEVDHLIALELGGSNALANLWPEPYGIVWNAHVKDHEENRLHEFVCDGRMSLAAAQHDIATNWIAAYQRDIGPRPRGETAAYEK